MRTLDEAAVQQLQNPGESYERMAPEGKGASLGATAALKTSRKIREAPDVESLSTLLAG
jgi:hypothetical protein